MTGTDLSTIPHTLDHEVEYLNVGILNQNKNVVVVTLDRRGKRNAINAKVINAIQIFTAPSLY